MIKRAIILAIIGLFMASCGTEEKKVTEEEQSIIDSLSRVSQKHKTDSLKKLNPLLILPPDSNFSGDYLDKYPTGVIKYKGYYRFGKRHGQWIAFYDSGLPWSEQNYNKGKREGANLVYFGNSKIRYKGFYKNDKRDSVWTFFDSLGTLIKTVVFKEDKQLSSMDEKRLKK